MTSTEVARMKESLRNLEARQSGLRSNVDDYQREISKLEQERRGASAHHDAYLRQQDIDRKIAGRKRDVDNTKRELGRIENEARNLRSALR